MRTISEVRLDLTEKARDERNYKGREMLRIVLIRPPFRGNSLVLPLVILIDFFLLAYRVISCRACRFFNFVMLCISVWPRQVA